MEKQIAIRLPAEILERVDRIAAAMAPGSPPNRAAAIRAVLVNGLEPTERQYGVGRTPGHYET